MPHQCTNCGRTFADGSKEMLSGCPDCGGNKFQFAPSTAAAAESFDGDASAGTAESVTGGEPAGVTDSATGSSNTDPSTESDSVTTRAAETVRDWMPGSSSDSSTVADASSDDPSSADTPSSPSDTPPSPSETPPSSAETPASPVETPADALPDEPAPSERSGSDKSWPSDGRADATDAETETSRDEEFTEWPETARRPEDRPGASSERLDESSETPDGESVDAEPSTQRSDGPTTTMADDEGSAQADARSEIVPPSDLPAHSDGFDPAETEHDTDADGAADAPATAGTDDAPPEHGRVVSEPSGDRPSIEDLRDELNEQFESIKIVRPGQYELNLMELYNRDEYIISLQEDGRYVIDVPDSWREGNDSDD
ncbi:hypothetical protein HYG81_10585 [Natrinema zhouii]|uniref:Origin-associated protein OapC n=1 Tax=Natrinema zhouii TaxID=1710539 RepID=A0A7D6CMB3_9EURY|nr:Zn-ribbon containing protein [Natrinema zhouii]QLK24572.1 hypothetical protein HYG81_10585 [Natrinema zhouii]